MGMLNKAASRNIGAGVHKMIAMIKVSINR